MRKKTPMRPPTIPVLAGTENDLFFKKILGKYDRYLGSNIYDKHTAKTPYYNYCWLYKMMARIVRGIDLEEN